MTLSLPSDLTLVSHAKSLGQITPSEGNRRSSGKEIISPLQFLGCEA